MDWEFGRGLTGFSALCLTVLQARCQVWFLLRGLTGEDSASSFPQVVGRIYTLAALARWVIRALILSHTPNHVHPIPLATFCMLEIKHRPYPQSREAEEGGLQKYVTSGGENQGVTLKIPLPLFIFIFCSPLCPVPSPHTSKV